MKLKNKMIASAIALIGFSASANAQVSAAANVEATIVAPIAITNTAHLIFGNVAVSPDDAGTVVMTHGGVRNPTGGVRLPSIPGTFSAAEFKVTGSAGNTYSISLPTDPVIIKREGGDETM